MKSRNSVKIISIILALISLCICLFIWGELSGFENGYFFGIIQNSPRPLPMGSVPDNGPTIFEVINIWYFTIAVGFCVYIIGKFFKSLIASSIICILSLSVAAYPFWYMFSVKNEILVMKHKFSYDYWLNNSIYFDWFLLFAVAILTFIQFTLIITRKTDTETFKIT